MLPLQETYNLLVGYRAMGALNGSHAGQDTSLCPTGFIPGLGKGFNRRRQNFSQCRIKILLVHPAIMNLPVEKCMAIEAQIVGMVRINLSDAFGHPVIKAK